jgi:PII-like signaling protein
MNEGFAGPGKELRIFIGESDRWQHRSLADVLLEMLREEGLAGATIVRGAAGFGAHSRVHTAHILRLSGDLPVVIIAIDEASKIAAVLPKLQEMVGEGLVAINDVDVILYRHRETK